MFWNEKWDQKTGFEFLNFYELKGLRVIEGQKSGLINDEIVLQIGA